MSTKHNFQLNNGAMFLAPISSPAKFSKLAGTASLDISFSEEYAELQKKDTPETGTAIKVSKSRKVEGTIKIQELDAKNFLLATKGKITKVAAGTGTFEATETYAAGDVIALGYTDVSNVVVKDSSTDTVLPSDKYVLRPATGSLTLLDVPAGFIPEVAFSFAGQTQISLFNGAGDNYVLRCETYNQAQNGRSSVVVLYKVEFSPVDSFSFVGEDFNAPTLKFSAYVDDSKPSDSVLGQFGYITLSE